jgi:hypothetical protein
MHYKSILLALLIVSGTLGVSAQDPSGDLSNSVETSESFAAPSITTTVSVGDSATSTLSNTLAEHPDPSEVDNYFSEMQAQASMISAYRSTSALAVSVRFLL